MLGLTRDLAGRPRLAARRRTPAVALSPALLGLGLGPGRRPGPRGRPGRLRPAMALLAGGRHLRSPRRLASLSCGPARLVVVRPAPRPGGRQRPRAGLHRRARGPRRVPAPSPGVRRRRQPPDQGAQGAWPGWPSSSPTNGCCGWSLRRLARQVGEQVLADGGHFERAPAYHCQVLADLIDVAGLLRASGREPPAEIDRGHRGHAALAGRGAHPRRPGPAAQRRLPGGPRACSPRCGRGGPPDPGGTAARAAGHRAGPDGRGRLAPARRRRAAVPEVAAGPRARRHVRLPGARGRGPAAGRHRHVHLRARAGARLRAVHRRAQHRAGGRGGLDRGVGHVPGRAAGPGQPARRRGQPGRDHAARRSTTGSGTCLAARGTAAGGRSRSAGCSSRTR